MRIALIGTRGVPARYGGFETAVEEIGTRLASAGHEVIVFCRSVQGQPQPEQFQGMRLVYLPAVRMRQLETLTHTGLSVLHPSLHGIDAAIVFNAANSVWLPVLRARGIPVATHVDGLEWQRGKWGRLGRGYYRLAESLSVRWSDALIADAQGIADYYASEFCAPTRLIAYGAPIREPGSDRLAELGLEAGQYFLSVARFEPENHVLEMVRGYVRSRVRLPLVVVGSAPYGARYVEAVKAAADSRVRFTGGLWDQDLLDQLYAHARMHLHGHSVGGTNPSLLRAAGAGACIAAFDVAFNREVVGEAGRYFATESELADLLEAAEADPQDCVSRGQEIRGGMGRYNWDEVADAYATLLEDLAARRLHGPRPSGRRTGAYPRRAATMTVGTRRS